MFFGIHLKNNSPNVLKLDRTLKLSQAVLAPTKNGNKDPVNVVAEYDDEQFILCVLGQGIAMQCPLDLFFAAGSDVKLSVKGSGTVHLTGYEIDDDSEQELDMSDSSSEESNEPMVVPTNRLSNSGSTKIKTPAKKAAVNGTKQADKLKKPISGGENDSSGDESSDEDFEAQLDSDDDEDMMSDDEDMSGEEMSDEDVEDEDDDDEDV